MKTFVFDVNINDVKKKKPMQKLKKKTKKMKTIKYAFIINMRYMYNKMAEGFRFIYLAYGFSWAENLSAQCMG